MYPYLLAGSAIIMAVVLRVLYGRRRARTMELESTAQSLKREVQALRLLHEPGTRNNAAMTYHGTFRPR